MLTQEVTLQGTEVQPQGHYPQGVLPTHEVVL